MLHRWIFIPALMLLGVPVAQAVDPYAEPDDSWIQLSGTVVSPDADSFLLDYGDGLVTVEMDDSDNYGDALGLLDGNKVTVYGAVDDDLYEATTVEADSVYVESLNTYFYASADDEEENTVYWTVETPIIVGQASVRGTVSSIDRENGEFTVDTGLQQVTVSSEQLGYNPVDEHGFQQISPGDRVSVTGEFDRDLFDAHELEAESVVTLADNSLM